MKRPARSGERGAALLAVLLLVAVTGAIAAAALEKMSLSRSAAANAAALDQARGYARGAGELALLALGDLRAADSEWSSHSTAWVGSVRRVALPGGGVAEARVRDAGNCFNLNGLVQGDPRTGLTRRRSGIEQFVGLMRVLAVPEGEARRIAAAAADWADSDSLPADGGVEDSAYLASETPYRTGNTLFSGPAELAAVAGMDPAILDRLLPWLCALPVAELAPINVNTLSPDQAPLLAALAPDRLGGERARRILEARPPGGWESADDFWRATTIRDLAVPLDVRSQLQTRTRWIGIETSVSIDDAELVESLLVDARLQPFRIASRAWSY